MGNVQQHRIGFSRARFFALCGLLSVLATACGESDEARLADVVDYAEGPNAMWYRFNYSAEYAGRSISGDRMVFCSPVSSGSFLGTVGSTATFLQIPQLAEERLSDGS